MLFAITWTFPTQNREEVNSRFLKTGGPPPEGVRMLGRWSSVAGGEGVAICETEDHVALARWANEWSDLMVFRIVPVMTDEEVASVIGS